MISNFLLLTLDSTLALYISLYLPCFFIENLPQNNIIGYDNRLWLVVIMWCMQIIFIIGIIDLKFWKRHKKDCYNKLICYVL